MDGYDDVEGEDWDALRRSESQAWECDILFQSSSVFAAESIGVRYACPCCRALTLHERGGFDTCPVCLWDDDGQDEHDAHVVRGGPNRMLSLHDARANYRRWGAIDEDCSVQVRPPFPNECLEFSNYPRQPCLPPPESDSRLAPSPLRLDLSPFFKSPPVRERPK